MNYNEAVGKLLDKGGVETVLLYLIVVALLLVLAANAVEAVRKLFGKKTDTASLEKHCQDSEDRFKRGEKHIAENHDHITDLKEGQRVMCVAVMALLNHELHNGNSDEMSSASAGLNNYLINRK